MAEPVRTKRTILQGKIEATPGTLESSWSAADSLPIYDAFNVFQAEVEATQVNRARANLDPSEFIVGIPTSRFTGKIYIFGSGHEDNGYSTDGMAESDVANLPVWARIFLQGAGYTAIPTSGGGVGEHPFELGDILFKPVSEQHKSISFRTWLDKYQHDSAGARGNLVLTGEAGSPVEAAFDFLGDYRVANNAQGAGMADVASDPGLPPRMCGLNMFQLASERTGTVITPLLKSFSLDLGTQVTIRRNANKANCVEEIGIFQEYQARLGIVIEVQDYATELGTADGVEDFIEAMQKGDKFAWQMHLGPYNATGGRGEQFVFFNHNGVTLAGNLEPDIDEATVYLAQMSRAPQYSDDGGIRTWDIEFALTGTGNNFLQILAR